MADRQTRLDRYLVSRGFFATRARAGDTILRGAVELNGIGVLKPSEQAAVDTKIVIRDEARPYVSRSAMKLKHALDHFGIDVQGCLVLDIGASTGGFIQVLLERGARGVIAVDAGHGTICDEIARWPSAVPEWRVIGVVASPITGADGNAEFLIAAEKHP